MKSPIILTSALALTLGLAACGSGGETATMDADTDTGTTDTTGDTSDTGDTSSDTEGLAVDAGFDQVVPEGGTATLTADAGSNTLATFTWEQVEGPAVSLSDATSASPFFTAPSAEEGTNLTFQVLASDGVNEDVTDTVAVEIWQAFDQSDPTSLGDFSDNSGWQCDVDTGIDSEYEETLQGTELTISANSIPGHAVGTFPNDGNPSTISAQQNMWSLPQEPEKTETATNVKVFGVTLDGVHFDRQTAECYDNEQACSWRYEALTPGVQSNAGGTSWVGSGGWLGTDCNNAHVQPGGIYHYHGLPESLINQRGDESDQMTMVGYAADGFPLYARWGYADPLDAASAVERITSSYSVISGIRPSGPGGAYTGIFVQDWEYVEGSGDLDECSGRFGVTPEFPDGIYHYYLTDDYPYIPKCVFGTVTDTAFIGPGG